MPQPPARWCLPSSTPSAAAAPTRHTVTELDTVTAAAAAAVGSRVRLLHGPWLLPTRALTGPAHHRHARCCCTSGGANLRTHRNKLQVHKSRKRCGVQIPRTAAQSARASSPPCLHVKDHASPWAPPSQAWPYGSLQDSTDISAGRHAALAAGWRSCAAAAHRRGGCWCPHSTHPPGSWALSCSPQKPTCCLQRSSQSLPRWRSTRRPAWSCSSGPGRTVPPGS